MEDADERRVFQQVDADGRQKRIDAILPRFEGCREVDRELGAWGEDWLVCELGAACKVLELDGKKIAVVGINTAWLCQDDQDWGRLTAGRTMIEAALQKAEGGGTDLTIVLGHHPLAAMLGETEWSDGDRIRPRLE